MWALMYDYMITYSRRGHVASSPASRSRGTPSDDGLTWTFHIRTGVKWSDGEDLTAEDIAYTYSRIIDGGPEASTWRSYLASVESATAPDDETVVLELKRAERRPAAASDPDRPRAHLEGRPRGRGQELPQRARATDEPVVGSGPFRLDRG